MNDAVKKPLLCPVLCLVLFAAIHPGGDAMNWPALYSNLRAAGQLITGKATLGDLARAWTRGADLDTPLGGRGFHQPYKKSVWIQAAMNLVIDPLKTAPLKFYQGDKEIEDAKLAAFWKNPAKNLRWEAFVHATAAWYVIQGEFFWLLDDTWTGRGRTRGQIILARPGDMRAIVRGGELAGWVWTDAGGRQHNFLPEDVIHEKTWNPYDQWRGLGRVQAAELAAETDFYAGKYARDTFANNGDMGDYIVAKAGKPTAEQEEQITQALREKRAARMRGDYKPMLLSADLEPKSPTIQPPDAAFVATRVSTRDEIFVAIGAPPSMATPQASYSIGSASDFFRMILTTSIPLGNVIASAMDQLTGRLTGRDDLEAWLDFDEHPCMQAVRRERIDAAEKLWTKGMSMQAINDYLDLGIKPFDGWEIGYLPFSVAPAVEAVAPKDDPTLAELPPADDTTPPAEKLRSLFAKKIVLLSNDRVTEGKAPANPARLALWQSHMAKRRESEAAFLSKFKRELFKVRGEVVGKIEAAKTEGKAITKSVAADFLFDLTKFKGALTASMRKVAEGTLEKAGTQLFAEVAKDDPFTMPSQAALQFLQDRDNKMSDVADEVFAQISRGLQEGITAGDTMDELADRVRAEFSGIERGRARTVAQTETAAAYGAAREEAMHQAGIQYKQWLTSHNDNVRPAHAAAEGQTVLLHEPFAVGDEELMFPGDPNGSAENVINCHCVQIPVAGPGEDEGE